MLDVIKDGELVGHLHDEFAPALADMCNTVGVVQVDVISVNHMVTYRACEEDHPGQQVPILGR